MSNNIFLKSIYKVSALSLFLVLSINNNVYASETVGTITSSAAATPLVCHDIICANDYTSGKVNMKPTLSASTGTTTAITITDTGITGNAYGNEIGWINFLPSGSIGVSINPTTGNMSGYAYSQTGSWVNFNATGSAQQVKINSIGQWDGYAWVAGAYGGWLHFDCVSFSGALCVTTDWRPIPNRTVILSGGGGGGGGGGGSIVSTLVDTITNTINNVLINGGSVTDSKQAAFNSPLGIKLSQNFPTAVTTYNTPDYIVGSQQEIDVPQNQQVTISFRADINDNKIIDVYDFNQLMVNWGKKEGDISKKVCNDRNIADVNCDGKVDVYDFNLLMVKWGTKIKSLTIKK